MVIQADYDFGNIISGIFKKFFWVSVHFLLSLPNIYNGCQMKTKLIGFKQIYLVYRGFYNFHAFFGVFLEGSVNKDKYNQNDVAKPIQNWVIPK